MEEAPSRSADEVAREHVATIAKRVTEENSCFSESELSDIAGLSDDARRKIERVFLRKTGSPIFKFAQHLDTRDAPFVIELLRNLENTDYSRARAHDKSPRVSFKVYSDKIVIESNENGFTPADVEAICDSSRVSKFTPEETVSEDSIGYRPNGLGFLSVFTVAYKVHIESNEYSFSLNHRKDDVGVGMFSPQWEEPSGGFDGQSSRITLYLHKFDDEYTGRKQQIRIHQEFESLNDTSFLLMKKLRTVVVILHNEHGNQTKKTTRSLRPGTKGRPTVLEKEVMPDVTVTTKMFHVTRQPAHVSLIDPDSEVTVAIPLKDEQTLREESMTESLYQPIFAGPFVPLQPAGLKFLIEADFVTMPNRYGVPADSPQNLALSDAIASCVVAAVQEFAAMDGPLQYQWMRWLPQKESCSSDDFSSGLFQGVRERLRKANTFRGMNGDQLKPYCNFRRLYDWWLDDNGTPLCEDLPHGRIYPAREYEASDLEFLKSYDFAYMRPNQMLSRLQEDLKNRYQSSTDNLMKHEAWWQKIVDALLHIYTLAHASRNPYQALKRLRVIPLETGKLACQNDGPFYFPNDAEGLEIPDCLGFKFVDATLTGYLDREQGHHAERYRLFNLLGVRTASINDVRQRILSLPIRKGATASARRDSKLCLHYLYLSDRFKDEDEDAKLLEKLMVLDKQMRYRLPSSWPVYLETTDPYGPTALLAPPPSDQNVEFPASFLHEDYMQDCPTAGEGTETWSEWLQRCLRLRTRLPLVSPSEPQLLSPELEYVSKYRPEKFIEALRLHWDLADQDSPDYPDFIDAVRDLTVLCTDGSLSRLSQTYLPLPLLRSICLNYTTSPISKFLRFEEDEITADLWPSKWNFLVDELGVRTRTDIEFYVEILGAIQVVGPNDPNHSFPTGAAIMDIYKEIQGLFLASGYNLVTRTRIRKLFHEEVGVWIPEEEADDRCWASPGNCVWKAPRRMLSQFDLERSYRAVLEGNENKMFSLALFFRTTLGIRDWQAHDAFAELSWLRRQPDCSPSSVLERAGELYRLIDQSRDELGANLLKDCFNLAEDPLIYAEAAEGTGWYPVDQCGWSTLPGHQLLAPFTLSKLYPDLEDFFVDHLGVERVSVQMLYNRLVQMGNSSLSLRQPCVTTVKQTFLTLNTVSGGAIPPWHANMLSELKIFPVKHVDGQTTLARKSESFLIVDNKTVGDVFASRIRTLDYSLNEVRQMERLISLLRLEDRYISVATQVSSAVPPQAQLSNLQELDRAFSCRAHALYRIAVHWNSPRLNAPDELYRALCNAKIYATDEITTCYRIVQDSVGLTAEIAQGGFFVSMDAAELRIYMPRGEDQPRFTYFTELPRCLLCWMGILKGIPIGCDDLNAVRIMSLALTAPVAMLPQILDAECIVDASVPGIDGASESLGVAGPSQYQQPPKEDHVASFPTGARPSASSESTAGTAGVMSSIEDPFVSNSTTTPSSEAVASRTPSSETPPTDVSAPAPAFAAGKAFTFRLPAPKASASCVVAVEQARDKEYLRILDSIIRLTPRSSEPTYAPILKTLDGAELQASSLPQAFEDLSSENDVTDVRVSERGPDWDDRIAAAGELSVVEKFCGCYAWSFGLENWRSARRQHVSVHHRYESVKPWDGPSLTDIVWDDRWHVFTHSVWLGEDDPLVEHARGAGFRFGDGKPKYVRYLIDVKSTTGERHEPFFISKRHWQKVHQTVIQSREAAHNVLNVYVIIRVYNLGKDDFGMHIFIDPEAHRRNGTLLFTEEASGYSVVPY